MILHYFIQLIRKNKYKSEGLPWGLEITQFAYLILSLLGTLVFVGGLFLFDEIDFKFIWMGIIAGIFWLLFYGTWKIRNWVVTPILVFSSISLIPNLLTIFTTRPETAGELFVKSVSLVMAIFFLSQLYIFTRPKTKEFFREKGTTLVS